MVFSYVYEGCKDNVNTVLPQIVMRIQEIDKWVNMNYRVQHKSKWNIDFCRNYQNKPAKVINQVIGVQFT